LNIEQALSDTTTAITTSPFRTGKSNFGNFNTRKGKNSDV
jgi:hypothetical protein